MKIAKGKSEYLTDLVMEKAIEFVDTIASPFFLYYGYKLEDIYLTEYKTLVQFNHAVLNALCNCLKLGDPPKMNHTSETYFVKTPTLNNAVYPQVFDTTLKFEKNLSVLDLIFNLGPEAKDYLVSL